MAEPEFVLEHPNRETAAAKSTRAIVLVLLLLSAFLILVVTVGGWDVLTGARQLQILWIVLYVVLAFFMTKWRSGMLPLTAALAAILGIFATISAPVWFSRDADGFTDPLLPSGSLGLVTAIIVPVQLLLIAFALRGFSQQWHVEVERMPDGSTRAAKMWA